ncbi:hypothetical protein SCOR_11225 [Sulfidibacter corallicola]
MLRGSALPTFRSGPSEEFPNPQIFVVPGRYIRRMYSSKSPL